MLQLVGSDHGKYYLDKLPGILTRVNRYSQYSKYINIYVYHLKKWNNLQWKEHTKQNSDQVFQ